MANTATAFDDTCIYPKDEQFHSEDTKEHEQLLQIKHIGGHIFRYKFPLQLLVTWYLRRPVYQRSNKSRSTLTIKDTQRGRWSRYLGHIENGKLTHNYFFKHNYCKLRA